MIGHWLAMPRRSVVAGLLCLFLFGILALEVNGRVFAEFDLRILVAIQPLALPGLDFIVAGVTQIGEPEATTLFAVLLTGGRLLARRRDFWVPLAIGLVIAAEYGSKQFINQPQPAELGPSLTGINSFPSGHVARQTFLLLLAPGLPVALVAGGIVASALARLWWGSHWTSDVGGGALLGAGIALTAQGIAACLGRRKG